MFCFINWNTAVYVFFFILCFCKLPLSRNLFISSTLLNLLAYYLFSPLSACKTWSDYSSFISNNDNLYFLFFLLINVAKVCWNLLVFWNNLFMDLLIFSMIFLYYFILFTSFDFGFTLCFSSFLRLNYHWF